MAIVTLGIDLAKNVFALHGVDATGRAVQIGPSVTRHAGALPPGRASLVSHNPRCCNFATFVKLNDKPLAVDTNEAALCPKPVNQIVVSEFICLSRRAQHRKNFGLCLSNQRIRTDQSVGHAQSWGLLVKSSLVTSGPKSRIERQRPVQVDMMANAGRRDRSDDSDQDLLTNLHDDGSSPSTEPLPRSELLYSSSDMSVWPCSPPEG